MKKRKIIYSSSEEDDEGDGYISAVSRLDLQPHTRKNLIKMATDYELGEMDGSDRYKIKKYLDGIIRVPFNRYSSKVFKKEDSFESKRDFLHNIRKVMNSVVFGQKNAKDTILQIIAKKISNPNGQGTIIALTGPPGVGKTSLIKDGLSKAYGVPFNFISLGGLGKGFGGLRGTDFSYIGSEWGKIVDIVIKSGCMDPIIFFDELDKVSSGEEGRDIMSSLIHLTDPGQNKEWEDIYFCGIPFDLSRATIIFSMNDESKINPVLRDRITIVRVDGFDQDQKMTIAKNFSLPKIFRDIGFKSENIIIPDDTVKKIIQNYCPEEGIRKLETCLKFILMKFNYYHLVELGDKKYKDFLPYKVDYSTADIILTDIFGKK